MYLYSIKHNRIKYKIEMLEEKFISMKMDSMGFFYETQSFKTPRKIYRIDFDQRVFRRLSIEPTSTVIPMLWKESKIPHLDMTKFKISHDLFHSFDQTKVPMTVHQKLNGSNDRKKPCLVFAYGGYGISMLPMFKLFFLLFIELFNGVVGLYLIEPKAKEIYFSKLFALLYTSIHPYSWWW